MLISKTVKTKWNSYMKKYYENKGYCFTKLNDEFEVNVEDLKPNSNMKVKVQCDTCNKIIDAKYAVYSKCKKEDGTYCCATCNKKISRPKTTTEQFKKEVDELTNGEYILTGEFTISHNNTTFIHKLCGEEFVMTPHSFREGQRCPYCRYERAKQTCLDKYGVDNVFRLEEFKEKQKQTMIERYGVEHTSQIPEVKEKVKNTMLQRYGVEYAMQSKDIQSKALKTNRKKYGVDYYTQTEEYKKRVVKTNVKKYGVVNPNQNKEVQAKAKATNLERYGAENVFASEYGKNKIKEYYLNNFGVEYFSQTDMFKEVIQDFWDNIPDDTMNSILEKRYHTNIKKYGVQHYQQTEEYKIKTIKTNLQKYGTKSPMQNKDIRNKALNTMNKKGLIATSRQQRHICEILNGNLNYFTGRSFLDIAFPNEMIYIEYNGGGHNLDVKLGLMSEKEFGDKERKRYFALKKEGWKSIVINTKYDKIPSDNDLVCLINKAKNDLQQYNWVEIDIDKMEYKLYDKTEDISNVKLVRIYKEVDV